MAANKKNITLRVDPDLREQAEELYSAFGITLSDVFSLTLRKSLMVGGLPFDLRQPVPNAETIAAMKEAEAISRDPNAKSYTSVEELFKELDADADTDEDQSNIAV